MGESNRMRRVNEAIRQVVSEGLRELKDPRIGFVTVTGVKATTDLAQAIVYVSVLGRERDRERTLAALQAAHGVLQARVNRELRFRRTPRLLFRQDDTMERAARLTELLAEHDEGAQASP